MSSTGAASANARWDARSRYLPDGKRLDRERAVGSGLGGARDHGLLDRRRRVAALDAALDPDGPSGLLRLFDRFGRLGGDLGAFDGLAGGIDDETPDERLGLHRRGDLDLRAGRGPDGSELQFREVVGPDLDLHRRVREVDDGEQVRRLLDARGLRGFGAPEDARARACCPCRTLPSRP